ncbi:uncharacterized protein LOC126896875 isoform X2 [Daktulosphaira vitifoliae]|uniref:uncharacterized protein LOC126896875 isoform X2 n=1 Tax=Daktulosphaira vitifoliae TaxID=58002 RepID=UPI0021AA522B|nr:uncharacterized protein LOC126896875 isoform X2 [Daktulosphaira vitifoliae]
MNDNFISIIFNRMLDKNNAEKYIFNIPLALLLGQYYILNPKSSKLFGYNILHIIFVTFVAIVFVVFTCTFPISLYILINDTNQLAMEIFSVINVTFSCCKIVTIIRNSTRLWNLLEVTRIDFIIKNGSNSLQKCRVKLIKFTYTTFLFYMMQLLWIYFTYLNRHNFQKIKFKGNIYKEYKTNFFQLYMPVSEYSYNIKYFKYIYIFEFVTAFNFVYFTTFFDMIVMPICICLSGQLSAIGESYSSVGHREYENYDFKTSNTNYNEIKNCIVHYQKILQKLRGVYKLFYWIVVSQLAVGSCTFVFLALLILNNFYNSKELVNAQHFSTIKMIMSFVGFSYQYFFICYLFGNVDESNESINFSIYSSNWTEMDLKNGANMLLDYFCFNKIQKCIIVMKSFS